MHTTRELRELFAPQAEQLEVRLDPCGSGWAGRVERPGVEGAMWVAPLGPHCLLGEHTVSSAEDFTLTESSVSDYACLCLTAEDTAASMPLMARRPHALLGGNLFSFVQPAGSIACTMGGGKTFTSRSLTFLPGFFDEMQRRHPGNYDSLFESFDQRWRDDASREILSTLRALGPRTGTGADLPPGSRIDRLMVSLAAANAERVRAESAAGSTESVWLFSKARDHIERNLGGDLSIDAVAAALYVGRTRLCAVFRAECGRGLAEYVRDRRMEVAAELLATTELPVAEVARRVGYPRASSFSATFAHCRGMNPAAWRLASRSEEVVR